MADWASIWAAEGYSRRDFRAREWQVGQGQPRTAPRDEADVRADASHQPGNGPPHLARILMDTIDMTWDPSLNLQRYPWLPQTPLIEVLKKETLAPI